MCWTRFSLGPVATEWPRPKDRILRREYIKTNESIEKQEFRQECEASELVKWPYLDLLLGLCVLSLNYVTGLLVCCCECSLHCCPHQPSLCRLMCVSVVFGCCLEHLLQLFYLVLKNNF